MAGVPDYKALEKKVVVAWSHNNRLLRESKKLCQDGDEIAGEIEFTLKSNLAIISEHTSKIESFAAQWNLLSEILIDLQAELKKAKRNKAKTEIKELEKKIKITDSQAKKEMIPLKVLLEAVDYFDDEIRKIAKALKKI